MTVEEARADLEAKVAASSNLVCIIFWCLDSAAYYSITDDSILPAVRDVSGKFHIHGLLIVAPSGMFNKSVKVCTPVFNIPTTAKKLLFSPLPCYWHQRCCSNAVHVSNLDDVSYENTLFAGLDGLCRIIKDTLFSNNVCDVKVINTSQLCVSIDGHRQTSTDTREALAIMWEDDPVHPSRDCYVSLAEHITAMLTTSEAPSTSSVSDRPLKCPGWLEADSASTVVPKNNARGRGGPPRGFNQRGRGCGPRGFRGRFPKGSY
jgi:hypothetical protein